MELRDRHLVVVGGTQGIGAATARLAAAQGARVTVTGRSRTTLDAALGWLRHGVAGEPLDFTEASSVASFAAWIVAPEHLVLSGSSEVAWRPFADLAEDALQRAFAAKFWGHWRVAQALAAKLPATGSITFVTGAAARAALPGTAGLAAVNGALEAVAKVVAVELAPRRVNTVSPGLTATEAYGWMDRAARDGMFADAAAKLPARRIGQPEDVARVILLAASNPFVTGATLDVDGGAHLAR